ncbi:hypothetical protein [Leptolyngbya sp. FACHB-17]|uniref:hypothetical protein n=1 Tax=unclassified Leptolyngbya TaxID=2650499 RepID=UPI0016800346|nr:hypothetical protein [Leptolyngbya sp. FACHB-17]MBD2080805.1 hypothetical protein [Leptolyngbya sp. FACHB-17]
MKRLMARVFAVLVVGLMAWTGFFMPAYANVTLQPPGSEEVISPDGQEYSSRQEAYEKAMEAANDPKGLDKEYEKDLKIFKKENPDQANLIEKAEAAVEKVVGDK